MKYPLFLGLLLLFCACENSMQDVKRFEGMANSSVEEATEVEMLYSDSAVVRMRLQAPLMQEDRDEKEPKRIFPDGVEVEFYGRDKQISSHLTALYAEYSEKKRFIVLQDSVVIHNSQGEQLETEELFWDERKNEIYSDKFVKVTTPTEVMQGYGFRSDIEFKNWEIDSLSGIFESSSLLKKPEF